MMELSQELRIAIEAAKAGGEIALKYFNTSLKTTTKKDNSILTIADLETEEMIKKTIKKAFPEAKFVAEESGGDIKEDNFWIIDPIDGTRIFARNIPQWSILIAKYEKSEITIGICYIPTANLLIYAEKGKGAYLNGKKVSVSKTSSIAKSFGSFGSLHRFDSVNPILRLNDAGVITRSYEHAYAMTFLAEGGMDLVIDGYGTPWDYAPFVRIIPEAGGKVTDLQGKPWTLHTKQILTTNGILHNKIIKIINK